jgi:hypothetical protein
MSRKKENVGAMVDPDYKAIFMKRCIDHNTNMAEVVRKGIKEWLESHPAKDEKFTGVS